MKLTNLKKKNKRLYNEWVEYYQERAEIEFDSLIDYRTMQFENEGAEEIGTNNLKKYLMNEIEYQLEMDKEQQYMEKEIYKLTSNTQKNDTN